MRWDELIRALLAEIAGIEEIAAIVGTRVIFATEGADYVVPGIEATILTDTVTELWEPTTVQFDIFGRTFQQVATIERILRTRYHRHLPIPIGDVTCWAQYSDGTMLQTPARDKFFARAVRFTFTPLRAAYSGG